MQNNRVSASKKIVCIVFATLLTVALLLPAGAAAGGEKPGTNYPYVFVSGYAGWGQFDALNNTLPYWGRLNGDLMAALNTAGFESYAACVDPFGSAWDRACELYAQLTGTVVDYGAVHAAAHGHERFGKDYSVTPLMTGWGDTNRDGNIRKINLVGHSFGGTTVRLFAHLMANGAADEVDGTEGEVSGFFTGGKADWIYSITTLATPHNGTSLLVLSSPVNLVAAAEKAERLAPLRNTASFGYVKELAAMVSSSQKPDSGLYDLSPDNAVALNARIGTLPNIYYFSFPTDATSLSMLTDNRIPSATTADVLLWPTIYLMGSYRGVSRGGIAIDATWQNNDGVVNTVSTIAPENAPRKNFNAAAISAGVWQVMPTYKGDHAAIIGGLSHAVDINAFYESHMRCVNTIPA